MSERAVNDLLRVQHENGAGGLRDLLERLRRRGLHLSTQCTLQEGGEVYYI